MRTGKTLRNSFLFLTLLGAVAAPIQAQECFLARGDMAAAAERPSPLGETTITLGGEEAKLCYGRPSAKGRTIFGGLQPFGQSWRMGANEATALHLPFAAEVGGVRLEPGSYSLYAMLDEGEWEIFVNGNSERWGVPINDEIKADDIGHFTRTTEVMDEAVEQLTFRWDSHGETEGHLVMEWERTRVEIPIHKVGM